MKYSFLAAVIVFLASCSAPETEQSIRDRIAANKKKITELNQEIAGLEKLLGDLNNDDNSSENIAVEVMDLTLSSFSHYIQVSGTAEAVRQAYISPEVSGQIREVYVKEGDYVEKGKLLAKLNSEVTESSIADLQTSLDLAGVVFEKQKRLWEKGIGSEIQFLNAKNNKESLEQKMQTLRAQLDMALIKSPVSGIVDKIYLKKGELAMPGVQLMQVVNLDELYINADVSETYLSDVREGDEVKVEFPVFPDKTLETPIYRKGNVINPNNRTFQIQLKLPNPDKMLKPNILSVIQINDFFADSAIVVPSSIIKQDISGSYLYAIMETGNKWTAKKVYIKTGKSYLDKTMVTDGLKEGMKVITMGYNLVSDGTEVTVKQENAS